MAVAPAASREFENLFQPQESGIIKSSPASLPELPPAIIQGQLKLIQAVQNAQIGKPVALYDGMLLATRYALAKMHNPDLLEIPKTLLAQLGCPEGCLTIHNGHETHARPEGDNLVLRDANGMIVNVIERNPNLPSVPDTRLFTTGEYVETADQLQEAIKRQIDQAARSDEPTLHVVAGPSGAGKSSFTKVLKYIASLMGINLKTLSADISIATERGPLRDIKDQLNQMLSHELYTVKEQTALVLLFMLLSGQGKTSVNAHRVYQRGANKTTFIGNKQLNFDPSELLTQFVLEGSDAIIVAKLVAGLYKMFTGRDINIKVWGLLPPSKSEIFSQSDLEHAGIASALARGRGESTKNPWTPEYRIWMLATAMIGYINSAVLVDAKAYGPSTKFGKLYMD